MSSGSASIPARVTASRWSTKLVFGPGFKPRYGLEADEYPTAQGFVAAGLGVALIPLLALGAAAHSGVVVRRVKGEQPVRQVWSATRAAIADQVPVRTMLDDLESAARQFVASMS